jgi:transcriptional regulator with PAS, ATPase and Fis domain
MGVNEEQTGPDFLWDDNFPSAVTVCDMQGVIIAMNRQARKKFAKRGGGKLIGTSLFSCHAERSGEIIRHLLASGAQNIYVVRDKKGSRLVQQIPWYCEEKMAGLVEIITPFTGEIPLKDRT